MVNRGRTIENRGQAFVTDEIARKLKKLPKMASLLPEDLVKYAEEVGNFLANKVRLKTSQIRKFLDAVNAIKSKGKDKDSSFFERKTILLKPKLAYEAGRQDAVKPLMAVLDPCMSKVKDEKDFFNFHRFVEAIVAYHRYHGGQDSI